jgi:hypothetical protein
MDAGSAFAGYLQRPLSHRERGDYITGRVRDPADNTDAQRISPIREYRNRSATFAKNRSGQCRAASREAFFGRCGIVATAPWIIGK